MFTVLKIKKIKESVARTFKIKTLIVILKKKKLVIAHMCYKRQPSGGQVFAANLGI